MGSAGSEAQQGRMVGSLPQGLYLQGCLGEVHWHGRWAEPGETSRAAVWQVEEAGGVARSQGRSVTRPLAAGGRGATEPEWGPCPTGKWPQSQTIQEKDVTILNSKQCDGFYHKFSKIPLVIRIVNSQMLCAEDADREQFCYVSPVPLPADFHSTWPGLGEGHGGGGEEGMSGVMEQEDGEEQKGWGREMGFWWERGQ